MSAMDIVVTKDKVGELHCTPFYVLFSVPVFKHSFTERVVIEVNEVTRPEIQMYKDFSGEVYFVDDENNVGANKGLKTPSTEDLKAMRLHPGENVVRFTALLTGQVAFAKIFFWDTTVKIVVTDIDGTITRSDVRGHLCSKVGVNWHHNSVTDCFQKVFKLGYKVVYITARCLSMEAKTRKYISELGLPSGPLLLSPKSFVQAFASEVISKDTKIGKLEHLNNLRRLFPYCENPLVAGFGNNENDEYAYTASGIPRSHIFIINKKSEIICASGRYSYEVVATEICKFFHSLVQELKEDPIAA